jgi:hypothetical protein
MSTASTDAPPTAKPTMMSRVGAGGTVVSAVALAAPLGYMAYAGANTVTLSSASSVQSTLLTGIIFTGVAALVGLIATALNVPALLKGPSAGRIAATGVSAIVLVASVLFLMLNLVPRVTPLNHLSNDLQPFGNALTKNCSDPLSQLTRDEHGIYLDAQVSQTGDAGGDAGFVKLLSVDIPKIQADTKALSDGLNQLNLITVPDAKYQDLVNRCIADEKADIDFLTNDTGASAIPVPAPFNVVQKTVSFSTLLNDAAGILSGAVAIPGVPLAAIPNGTFQTFVSAVLAGNPALGVPVAGSVLCAKDPKLTADGNQLYNDAVSILTTNTAPLKPDVNAIIGANTSSPNFCPLG